MKAAKKTARKLSSSEPDPICNECRKVISRQDVAAYACEVCDPWAVPACCAGCAA